MSQLPRAARSFLWAVWGGGFVALAFAARGLGLTLATDPVAALPLAVQGALFVCLAVVADLKQLRLGSANYSVATATNFACAIVLGPDAAVWVGALGALVGDLAMRKPAHKTAFNTAALATSIAAGGAVMSVLRQAPLAPAPADVPAFTAYALVNALVNLALVCTIIALASGQRLRDVLAVSFRGLSVPIVALFPLGLLMAVVYRAFGGWIGLLLLVLPVIAAYAALEQARRLRTANGELSRAATQKAELYEQLRAAHEQLKATQAQVVEQERLRALGQMASGVAHDFNNALAPVLGFTELLLLQPQKWGDTEHVRRQLELVHTAAKDAAQVVRQLREFYRKGDENEPLQPLDLEPLVHQVAALTEPRWRGQSLAAGITISLETQVEPVSPVIGDEAALREALTNLVFNAVDAMPRGGRITLRCGTRPDGQVEIEVQDEGTGMTEEVRRRCLDPFFTTKGALGTGMGLSMVHGIAQRHSGSLEIESAWGSGTTIRLVLPGCPSQAPAVPASAPVQVEAASERPLRVLVIDDEPAVREVLAAYLQSFGYVPETAVNGLDGLLRFRTEAAIAVGFDAVVTDRAMPEMNGDTLARALKEVNASVPVIMLTGFGDVLSAQDERPDGVDEVLSKPVNRVTLHQTLRRLTSAQLALT
ncbi:MAG TPA: ATP-binding protein [Chloroflexota bacterium]|nr:ATP-binding protein [Chloroflexota bacterium]